jgi:hypothetical protein
MLSSRERHVKLEVLQRRGGRSCPEEDRFHAFHERLGWQGRCRNWIERWGPEGTELVKQTSRCFKPVVGAFKPVVGALNQLWVL